MSDLAEFGILGIAVTALAGVVYRFVLVRLSTECDQLREEVKLVRQKFDTLVSEQQADYREVAQSYAEIAAKSRKTMASATELMQMLLDKMGDE